MSNKIDSTLQLLTNKFAEAAVKPGIAAISEWEADLLAADFLGSDAMYADLTKLRHHLEGGDLNGVAIGEMLVSLGGSTERAASHAEGTQGDGLATMAETLIRAGKSLGADIH